MQRPETVRLSVAAALAALLCSAAAAADPPDSQRDDIAQQRLDVMRQRVQAIVFRARDDRFPQQLEPEPLFRYDDLTRGYLDGTVWRLGAEGRPRALVTAELNPRYGGRPRIVYDFLSLSDMPNRLNPQDGSIRYLRRRLRHEAPSHVQALAACAHLGGRDAK